MISSPDKFILLPETLTWTSDIHVTHIDISGEDVDHRLFGNLTPVRLTTASNETIDTHLKTLSSEEQISEHFVLHTYACPEPSTAVFPSILAYETEACDQYPASRKATKLIFAKWTASLTDDIGSRAARQDFFQEQDLFTWLSSSVEVAFS
jgi:hypothetical protein